MQTKTVKIQYSIDVTYDENSSEFQSALESYREVINGDADADDLVKNAAYQALRRGGDRLLEGIGYVKVRGQIEDESLYSGIEIDDDDPIAEVDFD